MSSSNPLRDSHGKTRIAYRIDMFYGPYRDPDIVSMIERMHPPRVSVDNDSSSDCSLVKVDSANKHGILLEMVQFLTDLELVISKSYICSDGGWLMNVFHVTDQQGKKISDESLINYIQQAFGTGKEVSKELQLSSSRIVRPMYISTEYTALEMTATDRPGLILEISAVLSEMGCHISEAVIWTRDSRSACILYVADDSNGAPINDPCRVACVQAQLESVVEAHHVSGERRCVRLACPPSGKTHAERRLHQLMESDGDYEASCFSCCEGIIIKDVEFNTYGKFDEEGLNQCDAAHVKVENCEEKGYSVITVRSRDQPKLLFDTICALTDLQYVVFHAAVSSKGWRAFQFVRHKRGGRTLKLEAERRRLMQCIIAATERRVSHGVRLDVKTKNRLGLLSDITSVFRENGLSITRAEIGSIEDQAVRTFYVKDSSGQIVSGETLEMVKKEIGGTILVIDNSVDQQPQTTRSKASGDSSSNSGGGGDLEERRADSFGSLLWFQLERLSSNFKPIKS